jgi:hypothetical protein
MSYGQSNKKLDACWIFKKKKISRLTGVIFPINQSTKSIPKLDVSLCANPLARSTGQVKLDSDK